MRNSARIAAVAAAAGLAAATIAAPATAKGAKAARDVTLYDFVSANADFEYLTAALDATKRWMQPSTWKACSVHRVRSHGRCLHEGSRRVLGLQTSRRCWGISLQRIWLTTSFCTT